MTWQAVAEKDFRDAIRSRWLWALSVLFVLLFSIATYVLVDRLAPQLEQQAAEEGEAITLTSTDFFGAFADVITLVIPLIAVVMAYAAIAGERESGTMKLVLSLPHSRFDVVVGKAIGRGLVVAVPILIGFLSSLAVIFWSDVTLDMAEFVGFTVLTVLLGVVFVSLVVGVSAATGSNRRAMVGGVGVYFVFVLAWGAVVNQFTRRAADRFDLEVEGFVHLDLFLRHLNPVGAYESLALRLATDAVGARAGIGPRDIFVQQAYVDALGGSVPWFLSDAFVLLVLFAWAAVPLAIGYLQFESSDL